MTLVSMPEKGTLERIAARRIARAARLLSNDDNPAPQLIPDGYVTHLAHEAQTLLNALESEE